MQASEIASLEVMSSKQLAHSTVIVGAGLDGDEVAEGRIGFFPLNKRLSLVAREVFGGVSSKIIPRSGPSSDTLSLPLSSEGLREVVDRIVIDDAAAEIVVLVEFEVSKSTADSFDAVRP